MAVAASVVIALTGTGLSEAVVDALLDDALLILDGCGYTGDRLDALQKWLAAHLVASHDGTITSDKLGDAARTYGRATLGTGLSGTMYGQQAMALDTTGCLTRKFSPPASVEIL